LEVKKHISLHRRKKRTPEGKTIRFGKWFSATYKGNVGEDIADRLSELQRRQFQIAAGVGIRNF